MFLQPNQRQIILSLKKFPTIQKLRKSLKSLKSKKSMKMPKTEQVTLRQKENSHVLKRKL